MTPIPLLVRLRGLLARDKDAFWWKHFTDDEMKLRSMDVWQLAGVIEEADVRTGMTRQKIVAGHLLNVRLAAVQAKASWGAGVLGFVGAVVGGALSVVLALYLQPAPQSPNSSSASPAAPAASSVRPSPRAATVEIATSQALPESSAVKSRVK